RCLRLLPFVVSCKSTKALIAVEVRWVDGGVTGGAELGRPEQRPHHSSLVSCDVGHDLVVADITVDRSAIRLGQQSGAANSIAARAVWPGFCDRMADGAGYSLLV